MYHFQYPNYWPIFFDCTVNTEVHLTIFNAPVNQVIDEGLTSGYSQQEGTGCHMSKMQA
jgi:hypothetical protein